MHVSAHNNKKKIQSKIEEKKPRVGIWIMERFVRFNQVQLIRMLATTENVKCHIAIGIQKLVDIQSNTSDRYIIRRTSRSKTQKKWRRNWNFKRPMRDRYACSLRKKIMLFYLCNIILFFCNGYFFFLNILWNKVYILIMPMLEDIELRHSGREQIDVSIQRVIVRKGGLWDMPVLVRSWYYLDFDWREWHHLKSLRHYSVFVSVLIHKT